MTACDQEQGDISKLVEHLRICTRALFSHSMVVLFGLLEGHSFPKCLAGADPWLSCFALAGTHIVDSVFLPMSPY